MTRLTITLYTDFICPWCYLAKVRLDTIKEALLPDIHIQIQIKPYMLYPHIPQGGVPKSDFAKTSKPGMGKSLRAEAKKEKISFNYNLIDQIPSSLQAHRLVWLVRDPDQKYALSKTIFSCYFEEGKQIDDKSMLSQLAHGCGVKEDIIDQFMTSDAGMADCLKSISDARLDLIRVVPILEITPAVRLVGLQDADVWENYVRRAARMIS